MLLFVLRIIMSAVLIIVCDVLLLMMIMLLLLVIGALVRQEAHSSLQPERMDHATALDDRLGIERSPSLVF